MYVNRDEPDDWLVTCTHGAVCSPNYATGANYTFWKEIHVSPLRVAKRSFKQDHGIESSCITSWVKGLNIFPGGALMMQLQSPGVNQRVVVPRGRVLESDKHC